MKLRRIYLPLLIIGVLLVVVAGSVIAGVGYLNSRQRAIPIVFSKNAMLLETWNDYKKNNLDASSGRTIDKSQNNLTTSEGQSYTMLRAVWMDDKATFDKSWKFSQDILQRPDGLFSWKYGQVGTNKYGILTSQGGQNTATDADQDIALALLMGYKRWNEPNYLIAAKPIITAIWNKEVVMVGGKPVVVADDLESAKTTNIVVNPSYFAFANYKVFAKIDPTHDWQGLASNSYDLLGKLSSDKLDATKSANLPPDWITINRKDGSFIPAATTNLDTKYGYDAFRIPFRLALDYTWFHDDRDKAVLSQFGFLKQFWDNTGVLNASYNHDGTVAQNFESPAMYGASLGYFILQDPSAAKDIYQTKLQTLYSPDQQSWKAPAPGYYEDNWAWFGMSLYLQALPNLTEVAGA